MVSIQHTVWTCSSLQLSFCPLPWSFHKAIFALGMLPYNLSLWFHPHWSVNKLRAGKFFYHFSQFSCSVVSDTLLPHGLQHARLPILHYLLEFTQAHVHWVGDAIQPSHPLLMSSPPALNLSQHQGIFQWVWSSHQVAKVLELQLHYQSFQWIFRVQFL